MPKINRIRIVNFSYNNDNRQIIDETFNFFEGENALLNLANGGGKSVLVQLMLQPVAPKSKIQGRNFSDFFKNKKQPTFILTEWKLDYSEDYLLTGFICQNFETNQLDGEKNQRLRFLTFTSKYNQSNSWDIQNLKLIEKQGKILNIPNFREILKTLEEKERKSAIDFRVFNDDNMEEYRKHIAEFGISSDEWKNIIKAINDSEGGLEEIFLKCKTSDQLINEWFLNKTILKVIFKDKNSSDNLSIMMKNLVDEIVSNEKFIIEKNIFSNFLQKLDIFNEKLQKFSEKLENYNSLISVLTGMKVWCNNRLIELNNEYNSNTELLNSYNEMFKTIDFEERSYDYHIHHKKHQEYTEKSNLLKQEIDNLSNKINDLEFEKNKLEAVKIFEKIKSYNVKLSGVNQEIAIIEEKFNIKETSQKLEYSLKCKLEEKIQIIENHIEELLNIKKNNQLIISENKELSSKINNELDYIQENRGGLKSNIENFKKYSEQVEKKLNIKIIRNILDNIDESFVKETSIEIENTLKSLKNNLITSENEISELSEKINNLKISIVNFKLEKQKKENQITEYNKKIEEYLAKEHEIKEIFDKYQIDFSKRFDNEYCLSQLDFLISQYEEKTHNSKKDVEKTEFIINGIKNNCLHLNPEILSLLETNDIMFDTGEKYLLNQPETIREKLLLKNPIIPYSIIVDRNNLEKLQKIENKKFIENVLPVILFENINNELKTLNQISHTDFIYLLSNFENRLFNTDNQINLLKELETVRNEENQKINNYNKMINQLHKDKNIVGFFNYNSEFQKNIEGFLNKSEKELEEIVKQILISEENEKKSLKDFKNIQEKIVSIKKRIEETIQKSDIFNDFIEQNQQYEKNIILLKNLIKKHEENRKKLTELNTEIENLNIKNNEIQSEIIKLRQIEEKYKIKFKQIENVNKTEIIEGEIEELEERIETLKLKYQSDINILSKRKEEITEIIIEAENNFKKLNIEKEIIENQQFDSEKYDSLKLEIINLNNENNQKKSEKTEFEKLKSVEENSLKIGFDEIKKLGFDYVMPAENIKGEFETRRKHTKERKNHIEILLKKLITEKTSAEKIISSIEDIGLIKTDKIQLYKPEQNQEENITRQFNKFKTEYLALKNEIQKDENTIINFNYMNMKTEFQSKNPHISRMFEGLDSILNKNNKNYDDYYYLFERVKQNIIKINELIQIYENRLQNLEKHKKDVIYQSYIHGERVFNEMLKIAKNSGVNIEGRTRPVNMIKINAELDNEKQAMVRIEKYIEECIQTIREEIRQGKKEDILMKTINRLMSSRELLNKYCGLTTIPVQVFKIDLNQKASGHKLWEKAVSENSGGEKFVVFFAVISALMAYIRENTMPNVETDKNKDTRVLVMDNPFGPISSEHLLKPLFEIAKKYRTQLICLSDLKQHSIMSCFNLIYMLKIKTTAYDTKEYLKFEYEIKNNENLNHNEDLEKSIFRSETKIAQNLF